MTPAAISKRNRMRIIMAFGAVYLLWGSTFIAIKYAIHTIPPFLMSGTRFLIAGLLLYTAARLRGAPGPSRTDVRTAVFSGILMISFGNGSVVWAEQTVPSGMVALIIATVPVWMVLIDWLRPRGVRPRAMVFVGLALGLIGIVTLIGPRALGEGGALRAGVLIVLVGSLSWALGSILIRRSERPRSPLVSSAVQMTAGGIAFLVMSLGFREFHGFAFSNISGTSLIGWTYLVIFGSLIGYTAYNFLLGAVSAAKAATYAYVNPVVAVLLGWALANEPVGPRMLVAAAIILAGVAIITTTQGSAAPVTGEHPLPDRPLEQERSAA